MEEPNSSILNSQLDRTDSSIKRATLNTINNTFKRNDSFVVQQQTERSCFAHTSAKCIVKVITHFLPELFVLTDEEKENLQIPKDPYLNCFNESQDIAVIREKLAKENKCPIQPRYNYMIVFYYTLKRINKKFNVNGRKKNPITVLNYFANKLDKFYKLREEVTNENMVISREVDMAVKEVILQYKNYINKNNIYITAHQYFINTKGQNEMRNWIRNFPLGAREAIASGLYVSFGFYMTKKAMAELKKDAYSNIHINFPSDSANPSNSGHAVIIKDWSPENGVTILNSWGADWGHNGYVVIPPKYYYKFIDNNFTRSYGANSLEFSYLKINHGSSFFRNRLGWGFGGKNRSRKHIRSRNKKTKKIRL